MAGPSQNPQGLAGRVCTSHQSSLEEFTAPLWQFGIRMAIYPPGHRGAPSAVLSNTNNKNAQRFRNSRHSDDFPQPAACIAGRQGRHRLARRSSPFRGQKSSALFCGTNCLRSEIKPRQNRREPITLLRRLCGNALEDGVVDLGERAVEQCGRVRQHVFFRGFASTGNANACALLIKCLTKYASQLTESGKTCHQE